MDIEIDGVRMERARVGEGAEGFTERSLRSCMIPCLELWVILGVYNRKMSLSSGKHREWNDICTGSRIL